MTDHTSSTNIAFTPSVKDMQRDLGSREQMSVMARHRGFRTEITEELAAFIAQVDSFFLATVTSDGHPYIQHRGGPPGFLETEHPDTLRFVDYEGNRQYLTLGNLTENDRVHLFLIDYESKQRIKIWGRAIVHDLQGKRAIVIKLLAWDPNCQKQIPNLYREGTVRRTNEKLLQRISELEERVELLSKETKPQA